MATRTVTVAANTNYTLQFDLAALSSAANLTHNVRVRILIPGGTTIIQTFNATGTYTINFTSVNAGTVTIEYLSQITGTGTYIPNQPYFDIDNFSVSYQTTTTTTTTVCSVWDGGYRYGFNGMERDNSISTDNYDFGARIYDGRLGRWLSLDPLMKKYPQLTPYNFVDNSPINSIDADGRDIIILCANVRGGHPTGHMAILIGNDIDGWWYYSFDGYADKKTKNDGKTNGVHFKTLADFSNSQYNSCQKNYDDGGDDKVKQYEDAERDKDDKIIQRYNQGYRITTDKATDKKMKKAANNFLENNDYELLGDNCMDVVRVALKAGGLDFGSYITTSDVEPYFELILLPEQRQNEIEKKNKGKKIDNLLIRTNPDKFFPPVVPIKPLKPITVPNDVKNQKDKTKVNKTNVVKPQSP